MLRFSHRTHSGEGGFFLIEVLVAFLLLALFLGPLVEGVLAETHRAVDLQTSAGKQDATDRPAATLAAWTWGPCLKRVSWLPGPELIVEVAGAGQFEDGSVGLWADGWYVEECTPGATGSLRLPANMWSSRAGQELTVRYRLQGRTWGPPWRTVVPGPDGVVKSSGGTSGQAGTSGSWALHLPSASSGAPALSWLGQSVDGDVSAFPIVRGMPPVGCQQAGFGAGSQSWLQEEGRQLDVYF